MKLPMILIGLLAISTGVNAGDHSYGSEGSLDAHVHGTSELLVAIEGKEIEIEFESPAMNLLGFEHKANSDKDKATVKKAVAVLNNHDSVFSIKGTSCKLVDSSVDVSGVLNKGEKHDDHQGHDHGHDHDDHKPSESENHSEVSASYHFQCEDLNKLTAMDVNLFKGFPGIHEIKVMWLSAAKQGAVTLTSKNNEISFK